jgi:YesN/AraC family two-component response regulator
MIKLRKMKLYIKNMVCGRCKSIVKTELDKLGVNYINIELGAVTIENKITPSQHVALFETLHKKGFELIDAHKNDLIEKLKSALIDLEHYSDEDLKTSFSDYISLTVSENFISLNTLFAEIEGVTIEKSIIKNKVELIKELLVYDDLNLTEIALKLHYSSAAKLSRQFKSVTGLTPSHFRELRQIRNVDPLLN